MRWFLLLVFALLIQACGSDAPVSYTNSNAKFVAKKSYTFAAAVDPTTLTEVGVLMTNFLWGDSYVINDVNDENTLNASVTNPSQMISYDDLATYSYFLYKEPTCPYYVEPADHSYANGTLVLNANLFSLNQSCPMVAGVDFYLVFKAKKAQ